MTTTWPYKSPYADAADTHATNIRDDLGSLTDESDRP